MWLAVPAICPHTFFAGCKQSVVGFSFNIFEVVGRPPLPHFCRNLACRWLLPPASLLFHGGGASRRQCQSVVSEELAASGHLNESSGSLSSNVPILVQTHIRGLGALVLPPLPSWIFCFRALWHLFTGPKNHLRMYRETRELLIAFHVCLDVAGINKVLKK